MVFGLEAQERDINLYLTSYSPEPWDVMEREVFFSIPLVLALLRGEHPASHFGLLRSSRAVRPSFWRRIRPDA